MSAQQAARDKHQRYLDAREVRVKSVQQTIGHVELVTRQHQVYAHNIVLSLLDRYLTDLDYRHTVLVWDTQRPILDVWQGYPWTYPADDADE